MNNTKTLKEFLEKVNPGNINFGIHIQSYVNGNHYWYWDHGNHEYINQHAEDSAGESIDVAGISDFLHLKYSDTEFPGVNLRGSIRVLEIATDVNPHKWPLTKSNNTEECKKEQGVVKEVPLTVEIIHGRGDGMSWHTIKTPNGSFTTGDEGWKLFTEIMKEEAKTWGK